MQELRGKYVNVVLTVQEGKGMDFLAHSVYIVANFNGRVMESDICDPSPCPSFCTELVWESEKKDLRKVRSVNCPLRVECITLDDEQKRECVGFTLLSLRSAPVIPTRNPELEIPFKWYKLLGVPSEFKNCHPELYISLTLRDHRCNQELPPAIPFLQDFCTGFFDKEIIPIQFLQDGYIQIGNEEAASEAFLLTVLVKEACNLHLLLPENLVFRKAPDKYYLSFALFGLSIKSKPFYKDLHKTIVLDEKVCIKLLSNFNILKIFFEQYYDAIISFYNGSDKLGVTKIQMKSLVNCEELTQPSTFEESYVFTAVPQEIEISKDNEEEECIKPFVLVECQLEKLQENVADKKTPNFDEEDISISEAIEVSKSERSNGDFCELNKSPQNKESTDNKNHHQSSSINNVEETNKKMQETDVDKVAIKKDQRDQGDYDNDDDKNKTLEENQVIVEEILERNGGYGDQIGDSKVEKIFSGKKPEPKTRSMQLMPKIEESEEFMSKSTPLLKNYSKMSCRLSKEELIEKTIELTNSDSNFEHYKQYSFFIMVDNVMWTKKNNPNNFTVKFCHPKSNTFVTRKVQLDDPSLNIQHILDNVHCKLFLISLPSQVRDTIQNNLPTMLFENENESKLFDDVKLDASKFLKNEAANEITITCKLKNDGVKGTITVSIFLEEVSMVISQKSSDTDLLPTILDESIVTNSLEDLRKWKEAQMVDYLVHLNLLEKIHLTKLTKDWNARKTQLEAKLISSVEKCKALSKELQKTKANLQAEKLLESKKKITCHQDLVFNEDLYKNMVKYSHCDNIDLLTKITEFRLENESLKEEIRSLKDDIELSKKNTLTNEQTASLIQEVRALQEKLEEATNSKAYFKEEWKKAAKEVHDLKEEFRKSLHHQIQTNREELSQLRFDRICGVTYNSNQWDYNNFSGFGGGRN